MSDWQPIESAPKDGTTVLVFDPEFGVQAVKFHTHSHAMEDAHWDLVRNPSWGSYHHVELEPTHWMPLPEGPTD